MGGKGVHVLTSTLTVVNFNSSGMCVLLVFQMYLITLVFRFPSSFLFDIGIFCLVYRRACLETI